MLIRSIYDRRRAIEYARRWALSRAPLFYDFTGGGGNCTNFVSQCLLAGSLTMDPTPTFGWYYASVDERSPSWAGVAELYGFLVGEGDFAPRTQRRGPFCASVPRERVELGDVVQLANESGSFYHSLIVTGFSEGDLLVAAQSNDALDRPLSTYTYAAARFLHVEGVMIEAIERSEYYSSLILGVALPPTDTAFFQGEADTQDTTRLDARPVYPS